MKLWKKGQAPETLQTENRPDVKQLLLNNSVTLLFAVLCAIGIIFAQQPASYLISQVLNRLMRNLILILSLIIPVWAGLGLNFGIVLGAMSAQAAVVITLDNSLTGLLGLAVALLFSIPIASVLGILTGKLFNMTKGQEMITGMILGYFANGLYQLIFMYLCGGIIPMKNESIVLSESMGINGTLNLSDYGLASVLNDVWRVPLTTAVYILIGVALVLILCPVCRSVLKKQPVERKWLLALAVTVVCGGAFIVLSVASKKFQTALFMSNLSLLNLLLIGLVCAFISYLAKTKLGSDIKAVGQSIPIAKASGINVRRTRIIAVVMSTVIAAMGHLVYLQGLGIVNTYSSHDQISTYSVAALLVGGASTRKANIGQALLGGLLFHLLFIVAPLAGKNLFGDSQYGEYFRVFVSYAVIAVALALHTLQGSRQAKKTGK